MRYLVPILLLVFTACSEDKPTEPPVPVLDTKANESLNNEWVGLDITSDEKWKLLSVSEEGLLVSWGLEFENSSDKAVRVRITNLIFEDKDGFELANYEFPPSNEQEYLIKSSARRGGQGTFVLKIYDVDIANSITKMDVWASFEDF